MQASATKRTRSRSSYHSLKRNSSVEQANHTKAEVKSQGYAVLENAAIPIVGEGDSEPNDTYVEQHVASAKAPIDEGSRPGVVNRARVAPWAPVRAMRALNRSL